MASSRMANTPRSPRPKAATRRVPRNEDKTIALALLQLSADADNMLARLNRHPGSWTAAFKASRASLTAADWTLVRAALAYAEAKTVPAQNEHLTVALVEIAVQVVTGAVTARKAIEKARECRAHVSAGARQREPAWTLPSRLEELASGRAALEVRVARVYGELARGSAALPAPAAPNKPPSGVDDAPAAPPRARLPRGELGKLIRRATSHRP